MATLTQNKIRIRLKAYDASAIEQAAREIVETATRTGASVSGPVPLPTEKNVYCVIRSPFKDKDSREHFEIRTHKRLIDIHQPTPKTIDSLQRLDALPAGGGIEIKTNGGLPPPHHPPPAGPGPPPAGRRHRDQDLAVTPPTTAHLTRLQTFASRRPRSLAHFS